MAASESRIGIAQTATGAAMATVAGPLIELRMAMAPSVRPISMLPESPRKIVAGGKLNFKNPASAPPMQATTRAA